MESSKIRNVALVGHSGTGKTTLAEALLFRAGALSRMGRVEDGNTVCDADPEEHARGQSLALASVSFEWDGHRINLLDAPGYADFVADAHTAIRVADLAVFVIDAANGVQTQDELLWRYAAAERKPRLIFVNKMDRARASFDATLADIRAKLTAEGVEPVELPIGEEAAFHGVADLITEHAWLYDTGRGVESDDLPESIAEREHAEHDHLVEDVVEQDDELLERYLEGHIPTPHELEHALHEGVDRAVVFPVLVGSATGPTAVDRLAEFIVHVGPAPADLPPVLAEAPDGPVEVPADPAGPTLALVFRTLTDPYVGQLSYLRVLSGTLRPDDVLVNVRTGTKERLHGLVRIQGSNQEAVPRAVAGDIVAVTKLPDLRTGDTLAVDGMPVRLPGVEIPEPVYGIAITAASRGDEDKLGIALQKVLHEDAALIVDHDVETHQTVLRGAGEMHVQVTIDRLRRRHGVEVDTEDVKVAYRETLRDSAEAEGRHKKQSGGRGQFGVAVVRFEPTPRGSGYSFESAVVGGAIPKNLIPAVDKGIAEAMDRGGNHGFPVVDLQATVLDGKFHSVDSDEMSFRMAGSLAFREALAKAGTIVLEPISGLEIIVPTDLQGDVMGDLNSRRGHVTGTEAGPGPGEVTINAHVPASEVLRYAIELRSMTHGRGRFRSWFERYEELGAHLVDRLTPTTR